MPKPFSKNDSPLATPVQFIKGVGPALAKKLAKLNVFTVEDLFYLIPIRYVDRRLISPIAEITPGKERTVIGHVMSAGVHLLGRSGKQVFEVTVSDNTGKISAKWFHFYLDYMRRNFQVGTKVLMAGEISFFKNKGQFLHPEVEFLENEVESDEFSRQGRREGEAPPALPVEGALPAPITEAGGKILPVYPLTEGVSQKMMRKIVRNAWDYFGQHLRPALPLDFLEKYHLADPWESVAQLHFPASDIDVNLLNERQSQAHRTLIFDEFFFLELGLALKKSKTVREQGIAFPHHAETEDRFLKILPFALTKAQCRVLKEIRKDMERSYPMNRLLQGDVGSGKTVIALACSLQAIANGYQAVIMAPTEILAEQHFQTMSRFLQPLGIPCGLATGGIKGKERETLYQSCKNGEVPLVVGTHALIQQGLEFAKLGFIVIDEQHRFGVLQRQALHKKGKMPDVLVMTATPIPRTLALTAYGDLDVSVIDELPQGRKPIATRLYGEKQREGMYQGMSQELKKNHQIFVVYPLIEESEKLDLKNATEMSQELKRLFEPDYKVALLHGRLPVQEKESIMADFKNQKVQILAATSVVEVGVDCPNATVMVVEHAERFGLSQLHQLRGRVGRSSFQSYCILMADYRRSEEAKKRLQVMVETHDGFRIAEEDLAIRGPGEFLGTRQAGLPEFRVANLAQDIDILSLARQGAFELIEKDPNLSLPEHQAFRAILRSRWKGKLELIQIA
ncbi:MAG: ATP-dependent DNA helicase RecG [Deltaproteobacteria bacterium]|nr:ATP-dependent DNA helicase RecG [Deltaproteobacteria bacterium]